MIVVEDLLSRDHDRCGPLLRFFHGIDRIHCHDRWCAPPSLRRSSATWVRQLLQLRHRRFSRAFSLRQLGLLDLLFEFGVFVGAPVLALAEFFS